MSDLFKDEPKQEREPLLGKAKLLLEIITAALLFPFVWLWKKIRDNILPILMSTTAFAIVFTTFITIIDKSIYSEASEQQYKAIVKWTEELPSLKPVVQRYMNDNQISVSEYREIRSAYYNHSRQQYKDKLR